MASADLRKELECPVCLTIYTDPIIMECGHNFCRKCIACVLDTQDDYVGYSCPECRWVFMERPELQSNNVLRKIAEKFLSTQPDQEAEDFCSYCVGSSVLAVKYCLLCAVSLCDDHLKVHSKAPEHVFCDPDTSTSKKKCSIHKKILEYYCTEDAACICVSCSVVGGHVGHKMMSLADASEEKKKKLREKLKKLRAETKEVEKLVQTEKEFKRKSLEEADGETERVTALFRGLGRWLEVLEKRVLSDITRQAYEMLRTQHYAILVLEMMNEGLFDQIRHIEELCNMSDPLTVLQDSETGDLCDTEDTGRYARHHHQDEWNLDVAGISHTLHTGLHAILSGAIVQNLTQGYPLSKPCPQPTPTVQESRSEAGVTNVKTVWPPWEMSEYENISLDINTASNWLHLSDDGKTVYGLPVRQDLPETPERCQRSAVLSYESFSSGRHYWEVDVGRSDVWRVGMCYPSIARKGDWAFIGRDDKAWIFDLDYNLYSVIHNAIIIKLSDNIPIGRIRIYLDYEAGKISFYALSDPIRHLHTFTATFTEPLHAVLCVWEGCLKLSGSNQGV